jgi:hypothetical protein
MPALLLVVGIGAKAPFKFLKPSYPYERHEYAGSCDTQIAVHRPGLRHCRGAVSVREEIGSPQRRSCALLLSATGVHQLPLIKASSTSNVLFSRGLQVDLRLLNAIDVDRVPL